MRETYHRLCREEDEAIGYEAREAATRRREAYIEAELPRAPTGRLDMLDRLEWILSEQVYEEMLLPDASIEAVRMEIAGTIIALERGDTDAASHLRALAELPTKCLLRIGLRTLADAWPMLAVG